MKSNELRIGNYVNSLGSPTNITSIQKGESVDYVSTPASGAITINQINPIPLTEEWLVKFGGVSNTNGGYYWKNYLNVWFSTGENRWFTSLDFVDHFETFNHIIYVHQLQNLYFALTGEELIYKP